VSELDHRRTNLFFRNSSWFCFISSAAWETSLSSRILSSYMAALRRYLMPLRTRQLLIAITLRIKLGDLTDDGMIVRLCISHYVLVNEIRHTGEGTCSAIESKLGCISLSWPSSTLTLSLARARLMSPEGSLRDTSKRAASIPSFCILYEGFKKLHSDFSSCKFMDCISYNTSM